MQFDLCLNPAQQADINRDFETHWNIRLPPGVNVTPKMCKALGVSTVDFPRRETFDILFKVKLPYSDEKISELCASWNDRFTAYLLEHAVETL